ncbi:hypothetical protein K0M31_000707 [Melipona bicolor]|uniref:Uncharacterized protein n=1 Tax=Melipona bicolor TaxID=60889 RepID=A0AA40GEA5_9HYME|nr:hypothetical protein K0M31_000707 [Melipona bicolor]
MRPRSRKNRAGSGDPYRSGSRKSGAVLKGSDIKVPVAILNCLYARQLCFEDPSCSAILEIIPRVCGPELEKFEVHWRKRIAGGQSGESSDGNSSSNSSSNSGSCRTKPVYFPNDCFGELINTFSRDSESKLLEKCSCSERSQPPKLTIRRRIEHF